MAGSSLVWTALSINGEVVEGGARSTVRAEWDQASCHIRISSPEISRFSIQVELEVLEVFASRPNASKEHMIVLRLVITRPCSWLGNNNSTWRGHLGIHFDTSDKSWKSSTYKTFLDVIKSCFNRDCFKELTFEEVKNIWDELPLPVVIASENIKIGRCVITISDIARLRPGKWFSDGLVEYGLNYWCQETIPKDSPLREKIMVGSPFFLPKYIQVGFNKVKKWPEASREFFEKDYVLFPLFHNQNHFMLVIIRSPCNSIQANPSQPCTIYVLDSLRGLEGSNIIFEHVTRLIRDISVNWTTNDITSDIRRVVPHVPQQPNTYDCGVFVLHYARTFFSDPPLYCRLMEELSHSDTDDIYTNWNVELIPTIRKDLLTHITNNALEL